MIRPGRKIKLILVYPMTTGRNLDEMLRVIDSLPGHRQPQGLDAGEPEAGRCRDRLRVGARACGPGGARTGGCLERICDLGLGAVVTGLDIAAPLIQTARKLAARDGVRVTFDVGDAEALPYEVNSFDVISSAMGLIFAPDHSAVARELARACRPRGTIAFSAWREGAGWRPVTSRYTQPLGPGEANSMRWGHEKYARMLLGSTFELRFECGDAPITGDSGEHIGSQRDAGASRLMGLGHGA